MTGSADLAAAKADLRASLRAGRQAMTAQQIEASRTAVQAHVLAAMDTDAAAGRPWRRVFAYEPLPDEPGSVQLLNAMSDRGAALFVPRLRPDLDLDWVCWPAATTPGRGAVFDATLSNTAASATTVSATTVSATSLSATTVSATSLSDAAVSATPASATTGAGATVVLVPALAVDRSGMRLGRGGGSYDRALTGLGRRISVVALLHPSELLTFVPAETWDQPVSAVVTANGWFAVAPPNEPMLGPP